MAREASTAAERGLLGGRSASLAGDILFAPPAERRVSAADVRLAICALARIGDAVAAVLAGFIAFWMRHEFTEVPKDYGLAILLGALLAVNAMSLAGLYRFENLKNWRVQVRHGVMAWAAVLATLIAVAYFMKISEAYSRAWLAQWFLLALLGFVLIRMIILVMIARWQRYGLLALRVAVVDLGDGGRMVKALSAQYHADITVIGVFADPSGNDDGARARFAELMSLARRGLVDEIVVVRREAPVPEVIVRGLGDLSVNVRMWSDVPGSRSRGVMTDAFIAAPMVTVFEQPVSGWRGVAKRLEDLVLSLGALIVAAPTMAVIAVAIKLDSAGPVIYRQQRFGFNGNRITVLKFRTMAASAGNQPPEQARRFDPRVTRVGRLLRRTSLDELPQLINVLRGDMSLVGPRPHAVLHNEYYAGLIDGYLARHRVKPGITGWAQVNGLRGETDTIEKMEKRVAHDLYYIDNWSLLFDLEILVRTAFIGFVHRNAY